MKALKPATHPRVVDGEPVPNVSRREMKTLAMMADDAMDQLPEWKTLDLENDEDRQRLRSWIGYVLSQAASQMEWAFRRATETALDQAHGLMRDPKRYEGQRARRKEQKAAWAATRETQKAEAAERERQRVADLKAIVDEGKVALMPGLVWNIPNPPEPEGAEK